MISYYDYISAAQPFASQGVVGDIGIALVGSSKQRSRSFKPAIEIAWATASALCPHNGRNALLDSSCKLNDV